MRNTILILCLFFVSQSQAQDLSSINADLKLTDSLTFPTEIRIYEGGGITNYSSLFRMYKDDSDNWITEFYEHWSRVDGVMEKKTEKRIVTSVSEMEYVYLNLIRSFIFDLPSRSEINWKLMERGDIQKVERRPRRKDEEPVME